MRRPSMLPDLAEHTVDRDTWQGMAAARVPSAYPVPRIRLPRMLGGLKGQVTTVAPDAARIGTINQTHMASTWQVPNFDGNTSALTLICYHGGFSEAWDTPTDWVLLDQGHGTDSHWRLYLQTGITASGPAEPIVFRMNPGGNGYMSGYWAFFYNEVGGTWHSSKGGMTYTGTQCGFQDPGADTTWLQMGFVAHPWTPPFAGPSGVHCTSYAGTVGAYCYPQPGTYDETAWATKMGRAYYDEAVDGYVTFNANFGPSEQPIAVYWTP